MALYVNHSPSLTAILHNILYVPLPGLVVSAGGAVVTTVVVVVAVVVAVVAAVTTVVVVVVVSACPWPPAVLSVQLPPLQSSPQPAEGTQRSNGCADLQPTKKNTIINLVCIHEEHWRFYVHYHYYICDIYYDDDVCTCVYTIFSDGCAARSCCSSALCTDPSVRQPNW